MIWYTIAGMVKKHCATSDPVSFQWFIEGRSHTSPKYHPIRPSVLPSLVKMTTPRHPATNMNSACAMCTNVLDCSSLVCCNLISSLTKAIYESRRGCLSKKELDRGTLVLEVIVGWRMADCQCRGSSLIQGTASKARKRHMSRSLSRSRMRLLD